MTKTRITLAVLALAISASAPIAAHAMPANDTDTVFLPHHGNPVRTALTTPCKWEDGNACYWDAGKAGDGGGHSFYDIQVGHKFCVIYTQPHFNATHGFCAPPR